MTDPMLAWWRMWTDGAQTAVKFWETLAASAVVIDRRMPMIDAGLRDPWTADHGELAGMVTEKVQAFTQAGTAFATDMARMQGLWMQVMQDAMTLGTSRRLPSAARIAASGARAVRLTEGTLAAGGRALKPIHAKATANAKRLGKR